MGSSVSMPLEDIEKLEHHLKEKEVMPKRDMDQEIELALEHRLKEEIQLRASIRETPLKNEIGTLKLQLEEKNKELANKDRQIKDLEIQITEMDKTIKEKDAEIGRSSNRIAALKTQLEDTKIQLSEANILIKGRDEENHRLKAKTEELTRNLDEREKLQNQVIERLTNKVADLERHLKENDEEHAELEQRYKETSDSRNTMLELKERNKDSWETTLNKLALDEANGEIHNWIGNAETLRSEKYALAQELTEKDAMLKKKDAALEKAEKSLNSWKKWFKQLSSHKKVAMVEQELVGLNI